MKWWVQIKELQRHRWLPFFLPVIGTLLYIALAMLAIPSDLGDKPESEAPEVERPAPGARRVRATDAPVRAARGVAGATTTAPLAPPMASVGQ